MTPDGFRAALARLGLDQIELARMLPRDVGTVSRWARGVRTIPPEVPLLLAAWERHPELWCAGSLAPPR